MSARIRRLSPGTAGDASPVGSGVSELCIDYGSGVSHAFHTARRPACRTALRRRAANTGHGQQARDRDCKGLYKALSTDGNPNFGTVLKVVQTPGLQFTPQVASRSLARLMPQ
jgi:DNA-binding phage protein